MKPFCLMPASTPAEMPISTSKAKATAASRSVRGIRSDMMSRDFTAAEVGAEVAVEHPADVLDVLRRKRVVEVVALGRVDADALAHRSLAGEGSDRVAGEREHHREDEKASPR